ncbi:MAG: hypothetical protein QOJ35_1578 [Solirubrobacteraceae bacterium]|nr:hypothetical protein [Solirubrobacteraceae bacterium]
MPRRAVERAFDQAELLELLDVAAIEDVLFRAGDHRGARVLRAILRDHAPASTPTRSELEERFLAPCRARGLPEPRVNVWIALQPTGYEADFLWHEARLIVEVDGRDTHTTRRAFEHDRRRDQRLMLAGWRVVRFTWRQVAGDAALVAATVAGLIQRAA